MADIMKEYLTLNQTRKQDIHDDDDTNSAETVTAKAVTMACLFAASFVCGVIPIKLSQWLNWDNSPKGKTIVALLLCFGGGVLMCTTFLHLLPEIIEEIDVLTEDGSFPESPIHLGPIIMCVGFFVMYFVEECVHVYIHKREKQNEMKKLKDTLSIRRGEIDTTEDMNSSSNLVKNDGEKGEKYAESNHNHVHTEEQIHTGHSHIIVEHQDSVVMTIRGLLIVLALSIHELFEGMAVGLEHSAATVWYMFGGVAAHKFVIAFCIGVELVTSKTKTYLTIIYVFTFSVVSPIGIGIGILVSSDSGETAVVVSVILQGLATGTLLYVVYFEILQKDKLKGLKSYFAILLGFSLMLVLTILAEDQH